MNIKLTKNELRTQQKKLGQLKKYLPTLQLKKAMLQAEVNEARIEIARCMQKFKEEQARVEEYAALLSSKIAIPPQEAVKVKEVKKRIENIAGVEVPYFDKIAFESVAYSLLDTPPWFDAVVQGLKAIVEAQARLDVAKEKKEALEKELRVVSIRVNLFEKILIPQAEGNIKKIKVFLGDQELAAVSRAKVAKTKIESKKAMREGAACG